MSYSGYMSPEYAMDGIFSIKSDVFSFGVLLLQIISGKKNKVISQGEQDLNLLACAWRLWQEGKSLELLDKALASSVSKSESEVLRCIRIKSLLKIGLQCPLCFSCSPVRPHYFLIPKGLGSSNVEMLCRARPLTLLLNKYHRPRVR